MVSDDERVLWLWLWGAPALRRHGLSQLSSGHRIPVFLSPSLLLRFLAWPHPSPLSWWRRWGRSLPARISFAPSGCWGRTAASIASKLCSTWRRQVQVVSFNLLPVDGITLKKIKGHIYLVKPLTEIPLYKVYLSPPHFQKTEKLVKSPDKTMIYFESDKKCESWAFPK